MKFIHFCLCLVLCSTLTKADKLTGTDTTSADSVVHFTTTDTTDTIQEDNVAAVVLPADQAHTEAVQSVITVPPGKELKVSFIEKNKSWLKPTAHGALVGVSWLAAYTFMDEPIREQSQLHKSKGTEFVAAAAQPFGRAYVLQPIHAGLFLTGLLPGNKKFMKAAVISTASFYLNDAITSTIKGTAQRHRPNSTPYNDVFDGPKGTDKHHSFPSGHTSSAFATATAIATAFEDNKVVPIIAYGAATLVGLSRIHDNAHWTSDVIAGAALGYLSAKAVAKLYDYGEKKWVKVTPSFKRDFKGLSLVYNF